MLEDSLHSDGLTLLLISDSTFLIIPRSTIVLFVLTLFFFIANS